eukprot:4742922-Pyramimonas_sp.AAC.1
MYVCSDATIMSPTSQVSPFQADEQFWQMVNNKIQNQCAASINRQQNCPGGHGLMSLADFKMKANPDAARATPASSSLPAGRKAYPPVPPMAPAAPHVINVPEETQEASAT